MTILKSLAITAILFAATSTTLSVPVYAQVSGAAFEGFRNNSKDPISIDADELEVVDSKSVAIYRGNVKVRQGPSVISSRQLSIEYARGGNGGQGDIKRLIFSGGLVAKSRNNTVSAERGIYNVRNETIVLEKNVVISQGKNVAKGCKLTASLRSNRARLHSCGGRVKSVFTPGARN